MKAFLFDLDGTILDTEKIFRDCWIAAAEFYGYPLTVDEYYPLRSLGRPFVKGHIEKLMQGACTYEQLRSKRVEIMDEMIGSGKAVVEVKPGAELLLKYLKENGITTSVVTASGADHATKHLGSKGLLPYFDRIISARMVEKGKPAPDVYLYACSQLGLKPEECVAVEDSPNGVTSAFAAGCRVVMVPDLTPATDDLLPMLWHQVDTLDQIIPYIKIDGLR